MKETPMTAQTSPRELAHRSSDGVHVTLFWHPATNRVTVQVVDESLDEAFEFEASADRALDAFEHPFAYAAVAGVEYATRTQERLTLVG
jgi:hypothetical protein